MKIPYSTYDKLGAIDQGAIVENKRLGHAPRISRRFNRPSNNRTDDALADAVIKNPKGNVRGFLAYLGYREAQNLAWDRSRQETLRQVTIARCMPRLNVNARTSDIAIRLGSGLGNSSLICIGLGAARSAGVRVQAFNDSAIGLFLDHVFFAPHANPLTDRTVRRTQHAEPMNQLVRIGSNSSVVGIQNPWEWSIIAVVFKEHAAQRAMRPDTTTVETILPDYGPDFAPPNCRIVGAYVVKNRSMRSPSLMSGRFNWIASQTE